MVLLLLLPAVLSLLLFCAHLFRDGSIFLMLPVLFSLLLLLVREGWVARFFEVLLLVAALEWSRSALFLALERDEAGKPWLRAVLILAGVALFTLFSAALFETRTMLRFYPRHDDD
jgi:hypothetical protein